MVFRDKEIPLGGNNGGELRGICYVCPTCGELWAKAELAPRGKYMVACNSPCAAHGDRWYIGGSTLLPLVWWDHCTPASLPEILPHLSPELLRYEALMKAEAILTKGYYK
jgi:hypothetical protein